MRGNVFGGPSVIVVGTRNPLETVQQTVGDVVGSVLGLVGIKSKHDAPSKAGDTTKAKKAESSSGEAVEVPARDPDRPQDDPWDADAVRYLLAREGVADEWARGVLTECLRRTPKRVRDDADRVKKAAALAKKHGVRQEEEPRGKGTIVHLYRTDSEAPAYPATPQDRRQLLRDS